MTDFIRGVMIFVKKKELTSANSSDYDEKRTWVSILKTPSTISTWSFTDTNGRGYGQACTRTRPMGMSSRSRRAVMGALRFRPTRRTFSLGISHHLICNYVSFKTTQCGCNFTYIIVYFIRRTMSLKFARSLARFIFVGVGTMTEAGTSTTGGSDRR